jgi:hypothetical protein
MRISSIIALALAFLIAAPQAALAWGADGHKLINNVAARSLPDFLPAFVRSPDAIAEITSLGPEPDRLKDGGRAYNSDYDPAHYLDLDDDDTVAGVLPLMSLPDSREAYDTAIRKGQTSAVKTPDEYSIGYVPYSIRDGWVQVVEDFAIWRVDSYGETHATVASDKAYYATDRKWREQLTLRDIGYWGHFVADASQPLHITVHYNGWGPYPNPQNYTDSHQIHAKFETTFVHAHVTPDMVMPRLGAYVPSSAPILPRIEAYLKATNSYVAQVYKFEGAGAFDAATPDAISFTLDRLAAGGKMMRDLIADAYTAAGDMKVGYPGATVKDIESGTVPANEKLTGAS